MHFETLKALRGNRLAQNIYIVESNGSERTLKTENMPGRAGEYGIKRERVHNEHLKDNSILENNDMLK